MDGNRRVVESLIIRITKYEGYIVNTFTIHVVDSITATATDTNHLDDAIFFLGLAKVEQYIVVCHIYLLFDNLLFTIYLLFSRCRYFDIPAS